MSVALHPSAPGFDPAGERGAKLRNFIAASVLLHLALLAFYLLTGGIFGAPGPGGGEALTFQLAAGVGQDLDAAVDLDGARDMPSFADADVEPAPEPEPEVETPAPPETQDIPVRKAETPPEAERATGEASEKAQAGGSEGTVGDDAAGAGGDAEETIINKKGDSITAGQIRGMMTSRTLHLEMGRIDLTGGNRLTNTIIKLNPDGTSEVSLIYYHYKTFHREHSSTRKLSGRGKWWIEGNRWCHQSRIIMHNTKDCYDMTMDGPVLRLYYRKCARGSSPLCKGGRIAAEGFIK